jgi:hypothetical protein
MSLRQNINTPGRILETRLEWHIVVCADKQRNRIARNTGAIYTAVHGRPEYIVFACDPSEWHVQPRIKTYLSSVQTGRRDYKAII